MIVILGTGGTIAGTAAHAADNIGYSAAQLGWSSYWARSRHGGVLEGLPLVTEQVAQVDSKDMNFAVWNNSRLDAPTGWRMPPVQGVVITHGTDTLEETAWLLQACCNRPSRSC